VPAEEHPLTIAYIEHYLVQTQDLEASIRWYEEVLGLQRGPTPNFGFPVQWMYAGGRDVLHLTHGGTKATANRKAYLGQQSQAVQGSGVIDHIGFRCSGLRATIAGLQARQEPFRQRQVDAQGLYQLFLFDPNGVKIELNFPAAEAEGLQPELSAAGFAFQAVED
jgi:catechol 2,3-dioxygenase-like lactoylglutathione lyase family enzyme